MKKILILGGNSDIGNELVNLLENKDFILHIHYNKKKPTKKNQKIKYIKANLTNIDFKKIKNKFDKDYDVILNLVGYIKNQSFLEFDFENYFKTIKINSLIPLMIIRQNLDHMINNKYGRIINTSSVGVKFGGGEQSFTYSLSKHINEFIPHYIRNLCKKNILYNTLRIGLTDTKFHKKTPKKLIADRVKLIPMKKIASKIDIAKYIIFLIEDNSYIANEIINITGGE